MPTGPSFVPDDFRRMLESSKLQGSPAHPRPFPREWETWQDTSGRGLDALPVEAYSSVAAIRHRRAAHRHGTAKRNPVSALMPDCCSYRASFQILEHDFVAPINSFKLETPSLIIPYEGRRRVHQFKTRSFHQDRVKGQGSFHDRENCPGKWMMVEGIRLEILDSDDRHSDDRPASGGSPNCQAM